MYCLPVTTVVRTAPAPDGQPPAHEVPAGLLDLVLSFVLGAVELLLAVGGQGKPAAKLFAVVAQHPEEAGDAVVQVVVNLGRRRRLVQQDRGRAAIRLDVGVVRRKLLNDPPGQVVLAPVPLHGRSQAFRVGRQGRFLSALVVALAAGLALVVASIGAGQDAHGAGHSSNVRPGVASRSPASSFRGRTGVPRSWFLNTGSTKGTNSPCSAVKVGPKRHELPLDTTRPQPLGVGSPVGDQHRGAAGIRLRPLAGHAVEVQPPAQEQHSVRLLPAPAVEHLRLGTGEDEGYPVAVFGQPLQPPPRFGAVGRVQPNTAPPRLRQPVVLDGVVGGCCGPGPVDWAARVQVERPAAWDLLS